MVTTTCRRWSSGSPSPTASRSSAEKLKPLPPDPARHQHSGIALEVFGLLSTLRGRNPVWQTPDCTQRYTPAVPTTPAHENRPDQVHSTSRKVPHRWSEPPGAATPEVREAMLALLPSLRAFAI